MSMVKLNKGDYIHYSKHPKLTGYILYINKTNRIAIAQLNYESEDNERKYTSYYDIDLIAGNETSVQNLLMAAYFKLKKVKKALLDINGKVVPEDINYLLKYLNQYDFEKAEIYEEVTIDEDVI
jgi:hypothetical protein